MTTNLKDEKLKFLTWLIRALMAISITMTSWFLSQAWNKITDMEKNIMELKIAQSKQYSSADWNNAKVIMDAERLEIDRRIIRLEESIPTIKEALVDIKKTLDTKNK